MDNFNIDITSDHSLKDFLRLAFNRKKATHFYSDKDEFVLFWADPGTEHDALTYGQFPVKVEVDEAHPMIRKWLMETASFGTGTMPADSGSRKRGFRICIDKNPYSILKVQPVWAIYHK